MTNLMVLPSKDPTNIRVIRVPDDFERHEALEPVSGPPSEDEAFLALCSTLPDEVREAYSRTLVDLGEPRWTFLNTLFSLSEGCLYAQLVDLLDRGELPEAVTLVLRPKGKYRVPRRRSLRSRHRPRRRSAPRRTRGSRRR